ncbi:MAG: acetyl-CoA decarbonylase/synthase complex subunit gamma [Candidatus Altiarchaeota archaeon]
MAKITAMEAYRYLPQTNCKDCGETTCMSFALKLTSREMELARCPHLEGEKLAVLEDKTTPPVREVVIGSGDKALTVGGEEVMYRHELKFFAPCKIIVDVSDTMEDGEVEKRIAFVKDFAIDRMGETLRLDGLAARCATDDPAKYAKLVEKIAKKYDGPLILCSLNPQALEKALTIVGARKPLVYAATKDNCEKVRELARKYDAPVAVLSQDLQEMGELTQKLGTKKIILDPGLITAGKGLGETLNKYVMLRRSAIESAKELGYPVMCAAAAIWSGEKDEVLAGTYESIIAGLAMDRFASLIILHSTEAWSILPLLTLRQCIYTDPRSEPEVEAKLYTVGNPDEKSPVLVTTNFSLTYFTVEGDVRRANMNAWVLVINTKGFAVDTAVATGDLSAGKIKEALEEAKVAEKVKHKILVVPLFASHLRGAIEDETGWEVLVGPRDSSGIQKFLQEKWPA